jgi:hypothetical protein
VEAEHDEGGTVAAGGEHGVEGLGAHQGRVGVEDEGVAVEAVEGGRGLEDGVGGALLLGLVGKGDGGVEGMGGGCDGLGAVAGDDDQPVGVEAGGRREGVGKERRAGEGVQHLGAVRAHPGALPGGEEDDGGRHGILGLLVAFFEV